MGVDMRMRLFSMFWSFSLLAITALSAQDLQFTGTILTSNNGVSLFDIGTLSAVTAASSAAWCAVSGAAAGNSQTLSVSVDGSALADGQYLATITISGGGASNSTAVTISFTRGSGLAAPSALMAQAHGANVTLTWTDHSDNESGFAVERTDGEAAWVEIRRVAANVRAWTTHTGP